METFKEPVRAFAAARMQGFSAIRYSSCFFWDLLVSAVLEASSKKLDLGCPNREIVIYRRHTHFSLNEGRL
jgi:hypothetical protein